MYRQVSSRNLTHSFHDAMVQGPGSNGYGAPLAILRNISISIGITEERCAWGVCIRVAVCTIRAIPFDARVNAKRLPARIEKKRNTPHAQYAEYAESTLP